MDMRRHQRPNQVRKTPTLGGAHSSPRPLTSREEEVMTLIRAQLSNKEIAGKLRITPGTVQVHLGSIYKKLNVHSRAEARSIRRAF
jgi:DNA-binding NarL/FixJ family response regulator